MFRQCHSLKIIVFSNGIDIIGSNVFYYCTSLTSLYYTGTVDDWDNITISSSGNTVLSQVSHYYYCENESDAYCDSWHYVDETPTLWIETLDSEKLNHYNEDGDSDCDNCGYKLEWIYSLLSDGTYQITAYTGDTSVTELEVPTEYKGIEITEHTKGILSELTSLEMLSFAFVGSNTYLGYLFGTTTCDSNSNFVPSCLKEVIITKATNIGSFAFYLCINLINITIPSSVTDIGNAAFIGCSNLTILTIPSSVINIGDHAFSGCTNLTNIIIPSNLTSIKTALFNNCSSLTTIIIPYSVTTIADHAFSGCSALTSIDIPSSVTSIDSSAFEGCTNLRTIIIPESVTSIGSSAFKKCSELTSITIPKSVTKISDFLLSNCSNLSSIIIPSSVTSISSSAFSNCSNLSSITIPSSVTSIGSSAFLYCESLEEIVLPNNLISIALSTFFGCTSLTSVLIPSSTTSIAENAFSNCINLVSVYYMGAVDDWLNITINSNNTGLTNATIYYYSETQPSDTTYSYWYYDENGDIVIW